MEHTVIKVAKDAIYNAINTELIGYNKPLSIFVNAVMLEHESEFKQIINNLNFNYFNKTISNLKAKVSGSWILFLKIIKTFTIASIFFLNLDRILILSYKKVLKHKILFLYN